MSLSVTNPLGVSALQYVKGGTAADRGLAVVGTGYASVIAIANGSPGDYSVDIGCDSCDADGAPLSTTFWLRNVAATPGAIYVTSGDGQSATAGGPFANPLVVSVADANGNVYAGTDTVTFTVSSSSGASATLSPSGPVSVTNGLANVTATANGTLGPYEVVACMTGTSKCVTFHVNNAGSRRISVYTGDLQRVPANTAFSPLTVLVTAGGTPVSGATVTFTIGTAGFTFGVRAFDSYGNAYYGMDSLGSFTGTCVSWSAPASGPSLSGTPATTCTDTSGTAVIHPEANLYADVGGTYTVTSTLVGTDSNTTFTCQNLPEPPALIAIVGLTTASSTVNVAYPQIAVQVKDRFNGTISGTAVTLTSPGNGPSFTDTTLHATTNSSGIAIFTPTANTLANPRGTTFTVTATPDLAPSVSTTLPCHNDPGTAYQFAQHYTNDGDNQIVAVSSTYPLPLAVVVQDQYTNPVYSGTPFLFTVLSAPSGASAAFSGGANTYTFNTNDLGTVTTTLLRANTTKGSLWATASSTGIGSPRSFTLNSVNDTESSTWGVAAVTGHPESQSTLVNTSFQDLWVRVVDRWGNTVTSSQAQVVFTVNPSGGATLVQGTQTANSNSSGYASVPATANTVVGSYTVTGSLQSAKVRTDFPSLLELYVYDAYGNPIPGASVTFVTPTDGATATVATTVVADDSGIVHAQVGAADSDEAPTARASRVQ